MTTFIKAGFWKKAKKALQGELDLTKLIQDNIPSPIDPRPYKVYSAILVQSGTNPPVATVLENTLGNVTYSKVITGFFTATTSFVMPSNRTFISISNSVANTGNLSINLVNKNTNNNNQIYIETYNSSGVRTDSTILQNIMYFEIRIYNL